MNEPLYPLFLRDRDRLMIMIDSADDLFAKLEEIDVNDQRYRGWDYSARPIQLYMDASIIKSRVVSNEAQSIEIIDSIF